MRLLRLAGFSLQVRSRAINGLPAVIVDRRTIFGNPFATNDLMSREECVERYRLMLSGKVFAAARGTEHGAAKLFRIAAAIEKAIPSLAGHNLGCFCPLPEPGHIDHCHARVLLARANPQYDWSKAA